MKDNPDFTYSVRHNGVTNEFEVIECNWITVRGDGKKVLRSWSATNPDSRWQAHRYCRWLQGWSLEEIDALAAEISITLPHATDKEREYWIYHPELFWSLVNAADAAADAAGVLLGRIP